MSEAVETHVATPLRTDLDSVRVWTPRRPYRIVIDDVSGKFTRVSERIWQALLSGDADPLWWRQAEVAGWTRRRPPRSRLRFNPLCFPITLGSIDGVANKLAPHSGFLFATPAIVCWLMGIGIAGLIAGSRVAEITATLGSLEQFLRQSHPANLVAIFIATKVVHELAHAVMCRRMGSRCGKLGLLMLVGTPCPFCDVTDIWRQPSSARRAAVMLAGIYVELIVASLATFVWAAAADPMIRFHALNVMLVCGVSTILFNANPLMRYDGYYVLADLIGSVNLRQEARDALAAVVTSRIAGPHFQIRARLNVRLVLLSMFHVASMIYRLLVMAAIAVMLVGVAEMFQLRGIAIMLVIVVVSVVGARQAWRLVRVTRGDGAWSRVPLPRRLLVGIGFVAATLLVCLIPLPRYRSTSGWVDTTSAINVYTPEEGMIEEVRYEFGDVVDSGDVLLSLRNDLLDVQHARLDGQFRVASLRNDLSRRIALDRAETAEHWHSFQAAKEAAAARLASVNERLEKTRVVAPIGGVVIPSRSTYQQQQLSPAPSLEAQRGGPVDVDQSWCRISRDGKLMAVLVIDARDRMTVDVGTPVQISLLSRPDTVYASEVISVSEIREDRPSIHRRAAYQVLCPLPKVQPSELLGWLGQECHGVFRLPHRTMASDVTRSISEWLGGS